MPQLYVLRRFSSWSFRLSASMALLLSSAGLAASLLVGTATVPAKGPQLTWRVAPAPAQAASELAAQEQALPVSLSSMVPAYALTAAAPVPGPASYSATPELAVSAVDSAFTASTLRAAMQHSWRTFKLAFR